MFWNALSLGKEAKRFFREDVLFMKCPNCGKEMEEGTLHTRTYPFWTQQELRLFRGPTDRVEIGPIGDDTASVFTRDPFPEFPHAMLCRGCALVAFSGNLIENSKKDMK